jgi:hypothetical protein
MINSAEIDSAISAHEAEINRLRHDLEIAEAELRGMKMLRDKLLNPLERQPIGELAPSSSSKAGVLLEQMARYRGGRQPGAISKEWRAILGDLYQYTRLGVGFDENSVIAAAKKREINLKHSDARLRMISYKEHGYIESIGGIDGHWNVTDFAAKKFGFKENETPTIELEGAS